MTPPPQPDIHYLLSPHPRGQEKPSGLNVHKMILKDTLSDKGGLSHSPICTLGLRRQGQGLRTQLQGLHIRWTRPLQAGREGRAGGRGGGGEGLLRRGRAPGWWWRWRCCRTTWLPLPLLTAQSHSELGRESGLQEEELDWRCAQEMLTLKLPKCNPFKS